MGYNDNTKFEILRILHVKRGDFFITLKSLRDKTLFLLSSWKLDSGLSEK